MPCGGANYSSTGRLTVAESGRNVCDPRTSEAQNPADVPRNWQYGIRSNGKSRSYTRTLLPHKINKRRTGGPAVRTAPIRRKRRPIDSWWCNTVVQYICRHVALISSQRARSFLQLRRHGHLVFFLMYRALKATITSLLNNSWSNDRNFHLPVFRLPSAQNRLFPTTLVVQVQPSVRCVRLSVSLYVRKITFEWNELWPRYLARYCSSRQSTLPMSNLKVRFIRQSPWSHCDECC